MSDKLKILSVDKNHHCLVDGLRKNGFLVDEDYTSTKKEIENIINLYDGLIIRSRFYIDQEFLDKATNLKFIGRIGAGLDGIDEKYANEKNIILFNSPEGNRDAVGEHAVGMLLMLVHKLKQADNEVKTGIWEREKNRGDELKGKTLGIIGYGNMGNALAKRLQGFELNIIFYDTVPNLQNQFAKQVSLDDFFKYCDIVSLHTPQNESTIKMINSDFINRFKKPFYFINTARGKSVVTKDLVDAIKNGKILGAALDVLELENDSFENLFNEKESVPEEYKYLTNSNKVLLSPHIAGWTHQSKINLAKYILEKIIKWAKNVTDEI